MQNSENTEELFNELYLLPDFYKVLTFLPKKGQINTSLTCKTAYAKVRNFWTQNHLWVGPELKLKVLFCEPSGSSEAKDKARNLFFSLPKNKATSDCSACCLQEGASAPSAFVRGSIEYHIWQEKYSIYDDLTKKIVNSEQVLKEVDNLIWESEYKDFQLRPWSSQRYYRRLEYARNVDIAILCFDQAINFYAYQELKRQNPVLGVEVILVCTDPNMDQSWVPMEQLAVNNILQGKSKVCFCSANNSKNLIDLINTVGFRIARRKIEERKVRDRTLRRLDADIDFGFETESSARENMRHWYDFMYR